MITTDQLWPFQIKLKLPPSNKVSFQSKPYLPRLQKQKYSKTWIIVSSRWDNYVTMTAKQSSQSQSWQHTTIIQKFWKAREAHQAILYGISPSHYNNHNSHSYPNQIHLHFLYRHQNQYLHQSKQYPIIQSILFYRRFSSVSSWCCFFTYSWYLLESN